MTAARVLPAHWDGQRLLRFLAGLALLALAFAANAGLTGTAEVGAPVPAAVTSATVDVDGAAADPGQVAPVAPVAMVTVAVQEITVVQAADAEATGTTPRTAGSRAPPAG